MCARRLPCVPAPMITTEPCGFGIPSIFNVELGCLTFRVKFQNYDKFQDNAAGPIRQRFGKISQRRGY